MALLPTPVSPVMRMLAFVLAVFCIRVHSRCMEVLLNTMEVEVARVRSSAISWEYCWMESWRWR